MPTESDLLNAPDDDFMADWQLDFFRARLEAMQSEIEARLSSPIVSGDEMMLAADPFDRASLDEERNAALQIRERDLARLLEIRAALKRIATGDFGYCEATGEPIGLRRLIAYPTARLSVEAQQDREVEARMLRRA